MMEPVTERRVIILESDVNSSPLPSSKPDEKILKKPPILLRGKTCTNLKIKVFQKYCQLKEKRVKITFENDGEKKCIFNKKKLIDFMDQSNKIKMDETLNTIPNVVITNGLNRPFKDKKQFGDYLTSLRINHISKNGFPAFTPTVSLHHDKNSHSNKIMSKNIRPTCTKVKPYDKSLSLGTRTIQRDLNYEVKNSMVLPSTDTNNLLKDVKESSITSVGKCSVVIPENNAGPSIDRPTKTKLLHKLSQPSVKDSGIPKTKPLEKIDLKPSLMENITKTLNHYNDSCSIKGEKKKQHPNRRLQSEKESIAGDKTIPICELVFKKTTQRVKLIRPGKSKEIMDIKPTLTHDLDLSKTNPLHKDFTLPEKAKNIAGSGTTALGDLTSVKMKPSENCLLKSEKTKSIINLNAFSACTQSLAKRNDLKMSEKHKRVSESWLDVLETPGLWFAEEPFTHVDEPFSQTRQNNTTNHEDAVDYQRMLKDFVTESAQETKKGNGETLNDKRFNEMLEDPDSKKNVAEFYIPPARVESFFQKFTDNMTSEDCLSQVCEVKKWPEPQFKQKDCKDGFLFSCVLKTKEITPKKPASNESLAKELAAATCLNWLGLAQRKAGQCFWESTKDTYFTY